MATRPWITPDDVLSYTEYASVKSRSAEKLKVDIARAEIYICKYCNQDFSKVETADMEPVRIAAILVAEAIAYNATIRADTGGSSVAGKRVKSESFDDYSYTLASATEEEIDLSLLDIGSLLSKFIEQEASNGLTMRLRKL